MVKEKKWQHFSNYIHDNFLVAQYFNGYNSKQLVKGVIL